MIRRMVIGLGLIASMALAGTAGAAEATGARRAPDLTGTWKFEPKSSDSMQRPEGGSREPGQRGGRGGPGGPGGDGERGPRGGGGPGGDGERGSRDGGGSGGAARPARLPDLMHVTMTPAIVSFEDSTGKVLQEITTLAGATDQQAHAPGAQVVSGEWKGDHLEIQRPGRGETKLTETITLEAKGTLLVIRTAMPAMGDRPAREHKRVYRRVEG